MNKEIKRYADTGDLKSLKYIFVDSLDVDPTFVKYEEEYNYCKSIPGLLEAHRELTPFTQDKSRWTEEYWAKLKTDLLENFSDRRMMHMREVAKVYLAGKAQRILSMREQQERELEEERKKLAAENEAFEHARQERAHSQKDISKREQQERELEEERKKLAAENEAFERAKREKARSRNYQSINESGNNGGTFSKKAIGVVVVAVAVVAIIVILILQ